MLKASFEENAKISASSAGFFGGGEVTVSMCGHLKSAGELRVALLPDLADRQVAFFVGIKLNGAACC